MPAEEVERAHRRRRRIRRRSKQQVSNAIDSLTTKANDQNLFFETEKKTIKWSSCNTDLGLFIFIFFFSIHRYATFTIDLIVET